MKGEGSTNRSGIVDSEAGKLGGTVAGVCKSSPGKLAVEGRGADAGEVTHAAERWWGAPKVSLSE